MGASEKIRGTVTTSLQLAFRRRDRNFTPLFVCQPPPPPAIIPDARPFGTFENQDTRDGKTRYLNDLTKK